MTTDFFERLPILTGFEDLMRRDSYVELPRDWSVVAADIRNSTQAIQKGKYKTVNLVGVCVIAAVLNLDRKISIPFIFGGDGAALCIPDTLRLRAEKALESTREMAAAVHGLSLRTAVITQGEIQARGHKVLVAKHRVSEHCTQAAFSGGGVSCAERILKDKPESAFLSPSPANHEIADYSGLECRWRDIPSSGEEIVSLLVKSAAEDEEEEGQVYRRIFKLICDIYGAPPVSPIQEKGLSLGFGQRLRLEQETRCWKRPSFHKSFYGGLMRIENAVGAILMSTRLRTGNMDWGSYKKTTIANADIRKFDDMLRMILSGTPGQRSSLVSELETLQKSLPVVFGLSISPTAFMTCLIRNRAGLHYHFIDGSGGGYAAAAIQLKQQLSAHGYV